MFPMTITLNDAAQLATVMAALGMAPATVAQPAQPAPQVEVKKPAAAAPEQKAAATTPPIVEAPIAATPTDSHSETTPPATVDFNLLKTEFLALVQANREKALACLAQFGIAKLSDAKQDQYAAILAAIQA